MKHYAQPKTDGQRLFNLQYDYKNGRTAALGEMYGLLRVIAYKTINKISNGDEHVKSLSASERESKAHDAATYIIEQYIKRPTFCINKSMTGYLHSRIMRELYGGRKCDKMLVFTDELPERKAERHGDRQENGRTRDVCEPRRVVTRSSFSQPAQKAARGMYTKRYDVEKLPL